MDHIAYAHVTRQQRLLERTRLVLISQLTDAKKFTAADRERIAAIVSEELGPLQAGLALVRRQLAGEATENVYDRERL